MHILYIVLFVNIFGKILNFIICSIVHYRQLTPVTFQKYFENERI